MRSVLSCLSVLTVLCIGLVTGSTPATPCTMVFCFVDPCTVTTCAAYPQATCRSNYCGGCNAEFFDVSGRDVTALCNTVPTTVPTTVGPLSCPPPSGGFGVCPELCGPDTKCPSGQLCCNTGCGHQCMNGVAATQSPTTPSATPSPCDLIACALQVCPNGDRPITPPGRCCPECPPRPTTSPPTVRTPSPCDLIGCAIPLCLNGDTPITPPGQCCPECPPRSTTFPATPATTTISPCALVRCAYPSCPNGDTPITPDGQCCPVCPPVVCSAEVYPADFIPLCLVVQRRWTFAQDRSGCAPISFSPCGQEEEGYNVFNDQEACESMCSHLTLGSTTPPTPPTTTTTTQLPCSLPCPLPLCLEGYRLVTLPGQCCPTCELPPTTPTPPGCTLPCPLVRCSAGYIAVPLPGQCCPTCQRHPTTPPPPDCTEQEPCPVPLCLSGYNLVTLPGQCCQTCQRNCTGIFCDWPICPDGARPVNLPGSCCPSCPEPVTSIPVDCSAVRCALPRCAGEVTPVVPPGQCCPQCPEIEGCITSNGRVVASGDSFPAPDGCNTCSCGDDGTVGCTEIACVSPTPAVVRPTPLRARICPYVAPSMTGICSQMCSSDNDCGDDEMCCSNGCGRACVIPDSVPYYSIPLDCPSSTLPDFVSTCDTTQRQCTENTACAANQLCCQNGGCGRYCTHAVQSMQPCFAVRELLTSGLEGIPGAFVPACQNDGSFSPSQFHGSTGLSWCVNVRTGYPVSPFYPRGTPPQCSSCTDGAGRTYGVGESFPSQDCNTCTCGSGGRVLCTRIGCPPTCSLSPEPGPCRAAFPAFYYDTASASCLRFTYGGCGGNGNKFNSIEDCLTMCNSSSICLQPKVVGPCDALFPSYFFNSSSGTCERFNYGGCTGNQNRFANRTECLTACAPNALQDRCSGVVCGEPSCPSGSQLTRNATSCCPYCVAVQCGRDEVPCANGQCILRSRMCDSLRDCPNGEDELNCTEPCDFKCGDGTCIESNHVCDALLDCADHSDAGNCSSGLTGGAVYLQPSDIPLQCPDTNDVLGVCGNKCGSRCATGQACCETECGMTCATGISVRPVCRSIQREVRQSGLLGAFTPSCEEDGSFSEQQCHERSCWCVDVQTGQPVTDGLSAQQSCPQCSMKNGNSLSIGASFSSDDGCNTCKCTIEHGIICTNRRCITNSCRLGDATIAHEQRYSDICSVCHCISGSLSCNRTQCLVTEDPVKVTMKFGGDFNMVVNNEENVIREVKRTFLSQYNKGLKLQEQQIQSIQLSEGSIVVSVTLEPATAGANLTILLSQLEEDYMSGVLVIRYNGAVLEPTGEFQTGEASQGLVWWHILLISVGGVLVLMICITILVITIVALTRSSKTNRYQETKDTDYEVSFKKNESAITFE